VAAVATYILVSHLARGAEGLSPEGRAVFIKSTISTCLPKQRAADVNALMSEDALGFYCNCLASEAADTMSYEDLRSYVKAGSFTPAALAKIEAAGETCAKRLLPRCQRVGEAVQCR